ncbi:MAG: hypothetical protein A3G34_10455 [Candidatus Lindowbacteria bacterium RIFCSPLOWO2_12_FULL_62_27]|nr:MAG: hypothetical protein A3G34_10455 [Candidatus Lindowbacteria bacterium RIFCSPLOWO2_12_FULL_62_27]
MASRSTTYAGVPALVIFDRTLNISRIITPAIARIILDHVDDIRDFLSKNEPFISEELDNRQLRRAQQGD